MFAATVFTNPAFVALAAGAPSVTLGYFGFRHSRRVDATAAQGMIATVETGSIGQVIDGLNKNIDGLDKLVAALQSDNTALRERLDATDARVADLLARCEELKRKCEALTQQLGRSQP